MEMMAFGPRYQAQDKISEVSLTQERLLQEAVMTEFDRNGHSLKEVLDERMETYASACGRGLNFDKKTLAEAAKEADEERQRLVFVFRSVREGFSAGQRLVTSKREQWPQHCWWHR